MRLRNRDYGFEFNYSIIYVRSTLYVIRKKENNAEEVANNDTAPQVGISMRLIYQIALKNMLH